MYPTLGAHGFENPSFADISQIL
ncbi:hypothetical protein EYZ11_007071 [Aspergillus tanneri]|uniref:Uncharacterized protein n=1 Tax=Aspergillus tanneri TaxID=1220188 RepID=A0A4S3JE83_9EURO|nr:hypothetical protein EYZ11_007071 [Aspergillus tanneri]